MSQSSHVGPRVEIRNRCCFCHCKLHVLPGSEKCRSNRKCLRDRASSPATSRFVRRQSSCFQSEHDLATCSSHATTSPISGGAAAALSLRCMSHPSAASPSDLRRDGRRRQRRKQATGEITRTKTSLRTQQSARCARVPGVAWNACTHLQLWCTAGVRHARVASASQGAAGAAADARLEEAVDKRT